MADQPIKVGDTLYVFDQNRRMYQRDTNGRATGRRTYSAHFCPAPVIGEAPRSWLVSWCGREAKVTKADMTMANGNMGRLKVFTSQGMDDDIWLNDNRAEIVAALQYGRDAGLLRAVAGLLDDRGIKWRREAATPTEEG